MICSSCGTENNVGAKFCQECATPLAAGCPNCGYSNNPGAKFCSECATPLGASAPRGAATASVTPSAAAAATVPRTGESVAERRVVSVLFADLVGFTPFAEGRDSEDVRDTLSRYFDMARDVIERYGGTVEKFIGDAVMAVWGAPIAHEDDAERAVRAGLELVDAVKSLGPGIQARAGVLTGEAAVTLGATNQGMVAGDIVNTASRLQSVAPPGSVLVGEATHRGASAAIAFEEAGDQILKGKQSPVPSWRALRVVAEVGGRNRSETLEAPFVGRHEEMRLLKDLFHTTGREQRLRVVSVIGPAGIGKSRLAWEFSKYVDGLVENVYWHNGRCPAYGEGISFWALGEMVRERCDLVEQDDEQTTRRKVTETVAQWITDSDEQAWVERALLTLLGVESGMDSDQLFGAWRTFFERIAAQGTVALVFEDMHFADTGLLDFIDHLLEWSRGVPIYVVTLARPELIDRRQDWGAGKRNFVSMYLEPLPDEQMRELLAGLVPGLPDKAVGTIVARADGIPLYAVETVRSLVADGRLVEQDGIYVPQGDLTTLSVPETLTALIASRLDTLEETDRRILHDAAVLGQSFTAAALSVVADVPESELEPRLGGLVRKELLQRQMDARSPERGQYEFVQALIREVAYNTLSKKDRKKLHLAAARYLESLGSDEIAGALASHYLAAHANAAEGEEADALAGQARLALKAAATRASTLGAFDQAVSFLDQALSVTRDPTEQIELLLQVGSDSRTAGRAERSEAALREVLELARERDMLDKVARATIELGTLLGFDYRLDEARALIEPALAEFADTDEAVLAEMRLVMARLHFQANEFHQSLRLLEDVLEVAERRGLLRTIAYALIGRGNALWSLGRRREAYGTAAIALEIATENDFADVRLRVMGNLANALQETDVRASYESWVEGVALARKLGHRGMAIGGVGNLGYAAFVAGEWDAGLAEMDAVLADEMSTAARLVMLNNALIIRASRGVDVSEGLAEMERLGKSMSGAWRQFVADPEANAALAKGDLDNARRSFIEVAEDDAGLAAEYVYRAIHPAFWARDVATAVELATRMRSQAGLGPVHKARLATCDAGIAALHGRSTEALKLYREAVQGWRNVHGPWDEALTGIDMAELLDPAEPEVVEAVRSTRAILERLGAKPYVERLDAAAARVAPSPIVAPTAAPAEVAVTE